MLIIMPLLSFCLGFVLLTRRHSWRGAFVLAAIAWGAFLAVLTEALSTQGWIQRTPLVIAWSALSLCLSLMAIRLGMPGNLARGLKRLVIDLDRGEQSLLAGSLLLVLLVLAVAVVSPTNNIDSLLYNMPRVMHWTQNGSLKHFATGYHHQNLMAPWSETAIMQLRILWGSDRPANLIQWFSMVGSLIAVSGIAALIGAKRRGQIIAGVFAAALPIGLLQASSTQNDYVVAFWAACSTYLVVLASTRPLGWSERIGLGLAIGLGTMT